MSFDDDAAGEDAGFRPPPHPDDRLWRHPSEIRGESSPVGGRRQVGLAPQPRHPWPWGVVAVVGTATVLLAGAGALVLGFRGDVGGGEVVQQVDTTVGVTPQIAAPKTWLGIEGYDNTGEPGDAAADEGGSEEQATSSTDVASDTTDPVATSTVAPSETTPEHAASSEHDPGTTTTLASPMAGTPGVLVTSVDPEGPVAGTLQPGDVVLEVDGQPVATMDALLAALQGYEPGDQVQITYIPVDSVDGAPTTVVVTLAERPDSLSASASSEG